MAMSPTISSSNGMFIVAQDSVMDRGVLIANDASLLLPSRYECAISNSFDSLISSIDGIRVDAKSSNIQSITARLALQALTT